MDAGTLVPYIAIGIGFLVALIFITRAIFSIPAMVRYQKAIVKLLALQAKNNGAPEEQVQTILREAAGEDEKL